MNRPQNPSRFVPHPPVPVDEPDDRPFLLLEDLIVEPIEYTLSDFGDLPDGLGGLPPSVH